MKCDVCNKTELTDENGISWIPVNLYGKNFCDNCVKVIANFALSNYYSKFYNARKKKLKEDGKSTKCIGLNIIDLPKDFLKA